MEGILKFDLATFSTLDAASVRSPSATKGTNERSGIKNGKDYEQMSTFRVNGSDSFAADGKTLPGRLPKLIIIIERHNFIRECLCAWIGRFCSDFQLTSFPDVDSPSLPPLLGHTALAIFSTVACRLDHGWLAREIGTLRSHRPDLPIAVIVDEAEPRTITEMALRLGVQGYIPTTSTLEVGAAVVHLVVAGGTYIPHLPEQPEAAVQPLAGGRTSPVSQAKLTPRERKVLDLLEHGMSNKAIAYRLTLSESTVKVHVHRIIAKFGVHNRTEAVVAAYQLYARAGLPQPPVQDFLPSRPSVGPALASRALP